MSDQNLLAFGCMVAFIAVAGAYVYLRGRFESAMSQVRSDENPSKAATAPVRET